MRLGGTTFLELLRERQKRTELYGNEHYWDARASAREGLACSMWPSNVYNAAWDRRQKSLLDRALGRLDGRRMVDIGCGTGRMTRHFAVRGAKESLGLDFSPETVRLAEAETARERAHLPSSVHVHFRVADIRSSLGEDSFDDAMTLGCVCTACHTEEELATALSNITRLVRVGGRVIVLEPIHGSKLLSRVLTLSLAGWIRAAQTCGLQLIHESHMGFLPVRFALSSRDLPEPMVDALFSLGEKFLDRPAFSRKFADYTLLVFERVHP